MVKKGQDCKPVDNCSIKNCLESNTDNDDDHDTIDEHSNGVIKMVDHEELTPTNFDDAMKSSDSDKWLSKMNKEMNESKETET